MKKTASVEEDHGEPQWYEVRLRGHLNDRWATRFDGFVLTRLEDGITCLTGPVADQAMLHSLLRTVRDAGIPLLSINPVDPGPR